MVDDGAVVLGYYICHTLKVAINFGSLFFFFFFNYFFDA